MEVSGQHHAPAGLGAMVKRNNPIIAPAEN
jgi:hypothetical protein